YPILCCESRTGGESGMNQPPAGSPRPSGSMIVAGLLILAVIIVTVVGGFTALQPPDSVTVLGDRQWNLYQATLWISLAIYLLVTCGIIFAVFRYRRRSETEIPEQIHGSTAL